MKVPAVLNNPDSAPFSIRDLVRVARGSESQKSFCKLIGVSQASLSRYEKGDISPPSNVIEHCMQLVYSSALGTDPVMQFVHEQFRTNLNQPEHFRVRAAIACMVDYIARAGGSPNGTHQTT